MKIPQVTTAFGYQDLPGPTRTYQDLPGPYRAASVGGVGMVFSSGSAAGAAVFSIGFEAFSEQLAGFVCDLALNRIPLVWQATLKLSHFRQKFNVLIIDTDVLYIGNINKYVDNNNKVRYTERNE